MSYGLVCMCYGIVLYALWYSYVCRLFMSYGIVCMHYGRVCFWVFYASWNSVYASRYY